MDKNLSATLGRSNKPEATVVVLLGEKTLYPHTYPLVTPLNHKSRRTLATSHPSDKRVR